MLTSQSATNPYVLLAMHVMDSALKMEQDAKTVASLVTLRSIRPLTKAEQKRLDGLYTRMDRHEVRLKQRLNP